MGNRQQQLEQELDAVLAGEEGILGMALVSRDGIPVLSRFIRKFDQKAFSILVESAMVATLSGAAEEAMEEIDGGQLDRIIVEAQNLRMVVVGASADLLLVALTEPDFPLEDLDEPLQRARTGVMEKV